ncbi:MAG: DUF2283 domain-containing protein [Candidatus Bathyarchaeia archaeon]
MYRLKYDAESDVLMIIVSDSGRLTHAEEMGYLIVHMNERGKPLFLEVLRASRNIPLMIQALAKKEVVT